MSVFDVPQTVGAVGVTDHGALTGLSDNDHPQYRLIDDYEGGITATGANQAAAYGLTKRVNVVTGGNGFGVRLPPSAADGDMYLVINATGTSPGASVANGINCYPATGETIFPMAVNTRNYQSANSAVLYVSQGSGVWRALTTDLKSDHISRTNGDIQYFYGRLYPLYGIEVSGNVSSFSTTTTFSGTTVTSAAIQRTGTISPTALGAGPTANYNPTGLSTCSVIRQDMSAAGVVSGLVAQTSGQQVRIVNISLTGANTLTLNHEDAASTAANRFYLPGNANLVIANGGAVDLYYDGTDARWRLANGKV